MEERTDDVVPAELIARAKTGDREAFNTLVRLTHRRVHSLALRLTGNEHDANDVVQDTYVRAFRGLPRFREEARFTTWLHRITANTASTFVGRRRRHTHRDLDDVIDLADWQTAHNPELAAEATATGSTLERALARLPQRLERVVVLRDVHGMSHREIAEELDITESAAKVRLHRARHRLRELLSSQLGRDEVESSPAEAQANGRPELRLIDGSGDASRSAS